MNLGGAAPIDPKRSLQNGDEGSLTVAGCWPLAASSIASAELPHAEGVGGHVTDRNRAPINRGPINRGPIYKALLGFHT